MISPILETAKSQKHAIVILQSDDIHSELTTLKLFPEDKNQALADYFTQQLTDGKKIASDTLGVGQWIIIAIKPSEKRPLFPLRNAGGTAVDFIRKYNADELLLITENLNTEQTAAVVDGLILGDYKYLKKDKDHTLRKLRFSKLDHLDQSKIQLATITATAANEARSIADTPANLLTPTAFADKALQLAKAEGLHYKIIDEEEMRLLGMDAILAVSQGSAQEAKMICLEYKNPKATKTLAMVGKGLTFDAGGISLKNAAGMMLMKYDKCGGTSVFGAMSALAKIRPEVNIIAVIPSSENVIGSNAYKPGDVIGSHSGKTIEISNTDAEGRLILADALSYVSKTYQPDAMVNLATLTGAVNIALGRGGSAVAGTSDTLCQSIVQSGQEVDELFWQMPIWESHEELLESNYADLVNSKEGGEASLAQGYSFLKQFVGDTNWAALDIAATSWRYRGGAYIKGEGASGFGVRTLVQWALNF
ncbi:MAG: leucyl aminopeptidase family protein [Akkermansiaceae bacterium]